MCNSTSIHIVRPPRYGTRGPCCVSLSRRGGIQLQLQLQSRENRNILHFAGLQHVLHGVGPEEVGPTQCVSMGSDPRGRGSDPPAPPTLYGVGPEAETRGEWICQTPGQKGSGNLLDVRSTACTTPQNVEMQADSVSGPWDAPSCPRVRLRAALPSVGMASSKRAKSPSFAPPGTGPCFTVLA